MLDSIYHITLKLLKNCSLSAKTSTSDFVIFYAAVMDAITLRYEICKPLEVYRFYCMALYDSQTRRHVIRNTFMK